MISIFRFRALILLALAMPLLAAPTKESKTPSEIPQGYQDNPYQYRYGSVKNAAVFSYEGHTLTNLIVSPVGTYALFSEQLTFCGDETEKLDFSKQDLVVLIFSKRMHRRDCYDLLRIDIVDKAHAAGKLEFAK